MGDPACHMTWTCLSCGRFLDDPEWDHSSCPQCGRAVDGCDDSEATGKQSMFEEV